MRFLWTIFFHLGLLSNSVILHLLMEVKLKRMVVSIKAFESSYLEGISLRIVEVWSFGYWLLVGTLLGFRNSIGVEYCLASFKMVIVDFIDFVVSTYLEHCFVPYSPLYLHLGTILCHLFPLFLLANILLFTIVEDILLKAFSLFAFSFVDTFVVDYLQILYNILLIL